MLRPFRGAVLKWTNSGGLVWPYLLEPVTAGLLARGIAMLADLPQSRLAMTAVFVSKQTLSGMALAKSL